MHLCQIIFEPSVTISSRKKWHNPVSDVKKNHPKNVVSWNPHDAISWRCHQTQHSAVVQVLQLHTECTACYTVSLPYYSNNLQEGTWLQCGNSKMTFFFNHKFVYLWSWWDASVHSHGKLMWLKNRTKTRTQMFVILLYTWFYFIFLLYFANRKRLDEVHDCLSGGEESVLSVGLVLITAHLGKHRVWSNS